MTDTETPAVPSPESSTPPAASGVPGKRRWRSRVLMALPVILAALAGWYWLATRDIPFPVFGSGSAPTPAETVPSAAPASVDTAPDAHPQHADRLAELETALAALRTEQQALRATLANFVRREDMRTETARIKAELRALRASFPEVAQLESSQLHLSRHLLQLAEMEHRLFGPSQAVVSLLDRVTYLLRDNPSAVDLLVDLTVLGQEVERSRSVNLLQVSEALAAIQSLAARAPLAQRQYDAGSSGVSEHPSGFVDRLAAGIRQLVRIERLNPRERQVSVSRLQLLLALERMQVALLRRNEAAFEQERSAMLTWLAAHLQAEHADTQALQARLNTLAGIDFGIQDVDFASLIERLDNLLESLGKL